MTTVRPSDEGSILRWKSVELCLQILNEKKSELGKKYFLFRAHESWYRIIRVDTAIIALPPEGQSIDVTQFFIVTFSIYVFIFASINKIR